MSLKNTALLMTLALLLFTGCGTATRCVVYVQDEYQMTLNNANIYIDDWSTRLGTTFYNVAIGSNCWVGDVPEGNHTLNARWGGIERFRPPHDGTMAVEVGKAPGQMIRISTHRV